ncbi:MAG: hypothetical protein EP335_15400 [Alphaproteobacteria bacterium]|nr:MAG: hypothetical protein EP335_15400 [Alphaproteobacteria bacterium]
MPNGWSITLTPKSIAALTAGGLVLGYGIWKYCTRTRPRRDVYTSLGTVRDFRPTTEEVVAWARSPGGRTVNEFDFGALTATEVRAISNRLHTVIAGGGIWVWDGAAGSGSTDNARGLLDGTFHRGQCEVPARALMLLLTTPTPYGFGLDPSAVQIATYSGAGSRGFIAAHAGAPLGLAPNIYDAGGHPSNYYSWGNHKVVAFTDPVSHAVTYFDPSYATTQGGNGSYAALANMVAAQTVIPNPAPAMDQFGTLFVESFSMTDDAAPPALKGFYLTCAKQKNGLALATTADATGPNAGNFEFIEIGPFNPSPHTGAVANNFNYDPNVNYLHGLVLH